MSALTRAGAAALCAMLFAASIAYGASAARADTELAAGPPSLCCLYMIF